MVAYKNAPVLCSIVHDISILIQSHSLCNIYIANTATHGPHCHYFTEAIYSRHMLMDLVIAMVQHLDTKAIECLYQTISPWLKVGEIKCLLLW